MKTYNSDLCIGGPHDGQRYHHDGPYFRAPLLKPLEVVVSSIDPDQVTQTVEYVTYRRMTWHAGPEQIVSFWAADIDNPFSVLVRLLNRYEKRVDLAKRALDLMPHLTAIESVFYGPLASAEAHGHLDQLRKFLVNIIEATETQE